MKAYKIELLVIDFDELGENEIRAVLETTRYPNRCISPDVKTITSADIGEWDDAHPLNHKASCEDEYHRLFAARHPPT